MSHKNRADRLCCELANSGVLFWLPLLACPHDRNAQYCANQGLWMLILFVPACWVIQIFGAVNRMTAHTLVGVIVSGVYALLHAAFLILMLYLLINCVRRAMAVYRGEFPAPILFFEERAIIR